MRKPITTAEPLMLQILTVINKKGLVLLDDVSNHLQAIDSACHDRFGWEAHKQKIHEGYTSIFTAGSLEDFLKAGE